MTTKDKYQVFPPLSAEEYDALKADIAERGVQVPVDYDDSGNILDGHHRVQACQELGITDWPSIVRGDMDEEQKIEHVLSLNLSRRHLTREQRRKLVITLRQEGWSLRRIADRLGVGIETTRRDLSGVSNETPDLPATITGADGKQYPATKPKPAPSAFAANEQERRQVTNSLVEIEHTAPELIPRVAAGMMSIPEAKREMKKRKLESHRQAIAAQITDSPVRPNIEQADCVGWLTRQSQCDLLITDPPYSTDVDDIQQFASSWLPVALDKVKPTGRAYVFIGAYPIELAAYLSVKMPDQILVWTYRNTLGPSPKDKYKLNWQAILYYKMSDAPPLDCPIMIEQFSVQDINAPDGRQGNRYHTWQKPDEIAERFIRHATAAGDIVFDPFAGTGTFMLAAAKLGRIGRGCEIDTEMLKIAEGRGCKCTIVG